MNYLFFDIECATCHGGAKICEFAYYLCDRKFNIIKSENFLINPNVKFDNYVIGSLLHYTEKDYKKNPLFGFYTDKILSVLTDKNATVIGHTTKGDIQHVGDDLIRYGYHVPDMEFVDITELFKLFSKEQNSTALSKMGEILEIKSEGEAHTAEADAFMTYAVTKSLCEKFNIGIGELIEKNPQCIGKVEDYEKLYHMKKDLEKYIAECKVKGVHVTDKTEQKNIRLFISGVERNGGKNDPYFFGKRFCISENYELTHYNEIINIIQIVKNAGGSMVSSVKRCDVFVKYDVKRGGRLIYSKRSEEAEKKLNAGKKIEIVEFSDFIKRINRKGNISATLNVDFSKYETERGN